MTATAQEIDQIKQQLQEEIRFEYNKHFSNITFLLFISFFLETAEHYLETSSIAFLQGIFQGTEYWWNRILTDSLYVVAGYYIAFRFRDKKFFGMRFVVIWLTTIILGYSFAQHVESWYTNDWAPLWGDKTVAFFDMWSFIHIATGTVFGSFVIWWNKRIPEVLES